MSSPNLLRGRVSTIGAFYTVTTVIRARQALFATPALAHCLIDTLNQCAIENCIEPLAWVVMPDHVHWMFRLDQRTLSHCVQAMKSRSARFVNASQGTAGSIWQPGFHDHQIRDERQLRAAARYLVVNPIRRGLVERIEDYPFWWCRWIECSSDL